MDPTNINLSLNQSNKNMKCSICGRQYPETLLNIEGHIYHGEEIRCLDQKNCNRKRRKIKK